MMIYKWHFLGFISEVASLFKMTEFSNFLVECGIVDKAQQVTTDGSLDAMGLLPYT